MFDELHDGLGDEHEAMEPVAADGSVAGSTDVTVEPIEAAGATAFSDGAGNVTIMSVSGYDPAVAAAVAEAATDDDEDLSPSVMPSPDDEGEPVDTIPVHVLLVNGHPADWAIAVEIAPRTVIVTVADEDTARASMNAASFTTRGVEVGENDIASRSVSGGRLLITLRRELPFEA